MTMKQLLEIKEIEKLNLGCGIDFKEGFLNIDLKNSDLNIDLNKFPYPIEDNSFSYIYSKNCLEQLWDMRKVFAELHRISKPDAIIEIIVFHFSSVRAYHIFHKTFFRYDSLDVLKDRFEFKFEILEKKIIVSDNKTFLIRLIESWINKHPQFYEKTIIKNLFPAYLINFKLRAIKW